MSLPAILNAIAANPVALQPRAQLAIAIQELDPARAIEVWASTIRLAMSRGQFFPALFLCRVHIPASPLQMTLLREMAQTFGAGRKREGKVLPPPIPEPRQISVPATLDEQVKLGLQLAHDIGALGLPSGAVVPDVPIFSELPEVQFVAMGAALKEVMLSANTTFIQQGEVEQALYLLANGKVRVSQQRADGSDVELAIVSAPAIIGEMSLLSELPRRASVTTLDSCLAWRMDGSTVQNLTQQHPGLVDQLLLLVKRRLLSNLMQNSQLFQGMDDPEALLSAFSVQTVEPFHDVLVQGQDAPGLFVILHGEAEVWTEANPGATRTRVAVLNEGDAFGEMSLLTGEPTNATVLMREGGVLLHLPTEAFQAIRGVVPALESELAELMFLRRGELQSIASPAEGFEEIDDALMIEIESEA